MSNINDNYSLSSELYGHEKCIRCVCILKDGRIVTGGLDNKIFIWNTVDCCTWRWERCLTHHKKYVFALEPSDLPRGECQNNTFYSGGLDQIIYRVSANDGKILLTFEGHTSAICSIREICESSLLVSGSWDGTARIWDLNSTACKHIFPGHSYAVTVALVPYVKNGNTYLLSGSQNKTLFLWRIPSGEIVNSIVNSHNDIIRSIAVKKTNSDQEYIVATVSNDCLIKIWELIIHSGKEKITHKYSKAYHSSFIFDVLFSKNHNGRLFTASDDFKVGIWHVSESFDLSLIQTISLNSTIWSLAESTSIDSLITASDDGICRIWKSSSYNKDSESTIYQMESQKIDEYDEKNNHVYNQDIFNLDEEILDLEKLDDVIGTEFGEIKLFKSNTVTYAYKWAGNRWVLIGKVKNKISEKLLFSGDDYFSYGFYDYIFNIIINDRNPLKLPFNIDDNIKISVEKFCLREEIPSADYSNTICNLIKNRISKSEDTVDSNVFLEINTDVFEPFFEYKLFRNYNIDGLITNLMPELSILINSSNNETSKDNNEYMLFEIDIKHLNDFFNRIKAYKSNDHRLNELQIKAVEMDIIYRKMSNLLEIRKMTISIIDLWRILALHPQSSDIHKKSDQGWWLISSILKLVDSLYSEYHDESKNKGIYELMAQILIVSLRFLSNMFCNPTNRQAMVSRQRDILNHINILIKRIFKNNILFSIKETLSDNVKLSITTLFLNYTTALNLASVNSIETRNLLIINSAELIRTFEDVKYSSSKNDALYNLILVFSNNYYYLNNSISEEKICIIDDSILNIISKFIVNNNNCDSINTTEKIFRNLLNLVNRVKI
ncbi:hypothetical protein FG379_003031 [Cryptosporidium bovis]|uniref:uncharacterized protein n=1 Tax=Cryptosporidium bovis TaxID=310047 RepID=UPI003519FFBC|nr:hypothetical protein FG379_003031 [Cryptosporidium bovis]